jgi:hypothetical protein
LIGKNEVIGVNIALGNYINFIEIEIELCMLGGEN